MHPAARLTLSIAAAPLGRRHDTCVGIRPNNVSHLLLPSALLFGDKAYWKFPPPMDGLSAASSCIAVISLVIQLGDSAYKLYEFFESVKNAPSDVIRLRDGIDRIRIVLKGIQSLLEQQNTRRYAPPPSHGLCSALDACRKTLLSLELQVGRLQSRMVHKRLDKVWDSLRIPADKDKIQEANAEVEGAIAVLQLAMQMNSVGLRLIPQILTIARRSYSTLL